MLSRSLHSSPHSALSIVKVAITIWKTKQGVISSVQLTTKYLFNVDSDTQVKTKAYARQIISSVRVRTMRNKAENKKSGNKDEDWSNEMRYILKDV